MGKQGVCSGLITVDMRDAIEKRLEEGTSLRALASEIGVCFQTLQYWRKKWGGKALASDKGLRGPAHHNWKGGRTIEKRSGYVKLYSPVRPGKVFPYTYEHVLVMEEHVGRPIKPGEHIHHINGIPNDNRIENLHLIDERGHKLLHGELNTLALELFRRGVIVFNDGHYEIANR